MMEEEGARNQRPGGNTKILALGDNGNCLLYDSVTNLWGEWPAPEPETPTPDHGRFFSAVVVGGNIFIIGGEDIDVVLSKVSIYNVETGTWRNGPNLLQARCRMGTCVSSTNSIYVVGGRCGIYLNSAEMLNCDENGEPIGNWQTLPAMKTVRRNFEAAIVNDKVYAIGGYSRWDLNIPAMEVYDPTTNIWSERRAMVQKHFNNTVSTYKGKIYSFEDGFCENYNPVTNAWSFPTPLNLFNKVPTVRGSAVLNDKIYLIGGYDCTRTDIYDVATDTWLEGPPMPDPIGYTKCVSLN